MTQKMQCYSIPEVLIPNSDYQDRIAASVAFQDFAQAQASYFFNDQEDQENQRRSISLKPISFELNNAILQKNGDAR